MSGIDCRHYPLPASPPPPQFCFLRVRFFSHSLSVLFPSHIKLLEMSATQATQAMQATYKFSLLSPYISCNYQSKEFDNLNVHACQVSLHKLTDPHKLLLLNSVFSVKESDQDYNSCLPLHNDTNPLQAIIHQYKSTGVLSRMTSSDWLRYSRSIL